MQASMLRASAVSRLSATRPRNGPLLPARPHRAMFVRANAADAKDPGYYPLKGTGVDPNPVADDGYYPLENKGVGAPGISTSNLSSERTISTSVSTTPTSVKVEKVTVSTSGGSGGKGPSNVGKGGSGGSGGSGPVEPAASGGGKQLWDILKLIVGVSAILWGLNFLFNKLTKPPAGDKAWVGKAATAEHRAQTVRSGAQDVKEKAKKAEKEAESLVERGAGAVKHGAEAVKDKAADLLHRGDNKAKTEADTAAAATRGVFDGVKDTFSNVANKVSGSADSAAANVKGGVQAAANNIKGGVNAAGDRIKGLGGKSDKGSRFPAKTLATVGTIAGATVGAAAVIGGTALYFIDKSRKSGPSTKTSRNATSTGTTTSSTAKPVKPVDNKPVDTVTKTKVVEVKTTTPKGSDSTSADQVKATVVK